MDPDQDLFAILGTPEDKPEPSKEEATRSRPVADAPLGARLRALFAARYDHAFTRGRRKPVAFNQPIRIDDHHGGDVYPGFCQIHATVPDNDGGLFLLELRNPPWNPEVEALAVGQGGRVRPSAVNHSCAPALVRLPVRPKDGPFLRKLARAIRRVTARGQSYPDPNWKWLAPRTADAVERLAHFLDDFWQSARTAGRQEETSGAGGARTDEPEKA